MVADKESEAPSGVLKIHAEVAGQSTSPPPRPRRGPDRARYSATKYAVHALSEGLRQESNDIRVTVISPGFTRTELTHAGGDAQLQSAMRATAEAVGIDPSGIASAIGFAIDQPAEVNVSEIVVAPTAQA